MAEVTRSVEGIAVMCDFPSMGGECVLLTDGAWIRPTRLKQRPELTPRLFPTKKDARKFIAKGCPAPMKRYETKEWPL